MIYRTIAKEKNITIQQMEGMLGLTNGVIGKAIKRNSKIKPDRISKLLEVFPDINRHWLENGDLPVFHDNPNEAGTQDDSKGLKSAENDLQMKYIQALEEANKLHREKDAVLAQNADILKRISDLEMLIKSNFLRAEAAQDVLGDRTQKIWGMLSDLSVAVVRIEASQIQVQNRKTSAAGVPEKEKHGKG
jgi:hypothetical protein